MKFVLVEITLEDVRFTCKCTEFAWTIYETYSSFEILRLTLNYALHVSYLIYLTLTITSTHSRNSKVLCLLLNNPARPCKTSSTRSDLQNGGRSNTNSVIYLSRTLGLPLVKPGLTAYRFANYRVVISRCAPWFTPASTAAASIACRKAHSTCVLQLVHDDEHALYLLPNSAFPTLHAGCAGAVLILVAEDDSIFAILPGLKAWTGSSCAHALGYEAENGNRGHEKNQVIKLHASRDIRRVYVECRDHGFELTAFLEYALSSASVRASTKRRRRLGRFDGCALFRDVRAAEASEMTDYHARTVTAA